MASPAPNQPRPIVLVVDDEPMMRSLLSKTLQPYYPVMTAADGQEALDLVWGLGQDVGLVVTDIRMPRLNGLELAERLRQLEHPPTVLFISGTAFGDAPGPCLTKPFLPEVLLAMISRLLSRTDPQARRVP